MNDSSNKTWVAIIVVVLIAGAAVWAYSSKSDKHGAGDVMRNDAMMESEERAMMMEEPSEDTAMMEMDDVMEEKMTDVAYSHSGTLEDVTGGEVVRGITTEGNGSGTASFVFDDNGFIMTATMQNIPDPSGTDFYEGWLVRRGDNFNFISTGKLELVDGQYVNTYASEADWTDHDFYVLTLEPDDGDPAPADHIVEGTLLPL